MGKYYKWICPKCSKKVKWDGKSEKPDTTCSGVLFKRHMKIQMPLKEMPK